MAPFVLVSVVNDFSRRSEDYLNSEINRTYRHRQVLINVKIRHCRNTESHPEFNVKIRFSYILVPCCRNVLCLKFKLKFRYFCDGFRNFAGPEIDRRV